MISADDIRRSHDAIRPYIRRTPVVQVDLADTGGSGTAWLKLEQLQCSGSFKAGGRSPTCCCGTCRLPGSAL